MRTVLPVPKPASRRRPAKPPRPADLVLTVDDRRAVTGWAAACAMRTLSLFEARAPGDRRPREAIEAAQAYAADGKRTAHLRTVAFAAFKAARESLDPAATAAARSAGHAAGAPYTHPFADGQQVKHVLGSAVYAALARELATGPEAAERELRWAVAHAAPVVRGVLRRFPEPTVGKTRLGALTTRLDARLRG